LISSTAARASARSARSASVQWVFITTKRNCAGRDRRLKASAAWRSAAS
jgi:hypothetical protein